MPRISPPRVVNGAWNGTPDGIVIRNLIVGEAKLRLGVVPLWYHSLRKVVPRKLQEI